MTRERTFRAWQCQAVAAAATAKVENEANKHYQWTLTRKAIQGLLLNVAWWADMGRFFFHVHPSACRDIGQEASLQVTRITFWKRWPHCIVITVSLCMRGTSGAEQYSQVLICDVR